MGLICRWKSTVAAFVEQSIQLHAATVAIVAKPLFGHDMRTIKPDMGYSGSLRLTTK